MLLGMRANARPTAPQLAKPIVDPIGLYLHIPFCKTKCPYCDFNTFARIEQLMPGYTDALSTELRLWGDTLGRPTVRTVFFGGGTPSYLPIEMLERILTAMHEAFPLAPDAEVTAEANPGDLRLEGLRALRGLGVNRLSIGVQSFDDRFLKALGRRHSAAQAQEAYGLARKAGFDRVNIDLMFGLPDQSLADWSATLERALALVPPHISMYCLTLEKGTPLERWVGEGKVSTPDGDLAADMYAMAEARLDAAGYHHYEISNWALPGEESRHNLVYWRNEPYLGVGAGAHSSLGGFRFHDTLAPRSYVKQVATWATRGPVPLDALTADVLASLGPVHDVEPTSQETAMSETMFLGLRLLDGLEVARFEHRFGMPLRTRYAKEIAELEADGLLEEAGGILRLTPRAHFVANQVFVQFMG